jgi:hypothetical protein
LRHSLRSSLRLSFIQSASGARRRSTLACGWARRSRLKLPITKLSHFGVYKTAVGIVRRAYDRLSPHIERRVDQNGWRTGTMSGGWRSPPLLTAAFSFHASSSILLLSEAMRDKAKQPAIWAHFWSSLEFTCHSKRRAARLPSRP